MKWWRPKVLKERVLEVGFCSWGRIEEESKNDGGGAIHEEARLIWWKRVSRQRPAKKASQPHRNGGGS